VKIKVGNSLGVEREVLVKLLQSFTAMGHVKVAEDRKGKITLSVKLKFFHMIDLLACIK
jgi:hypothetical protein